MDFISDILIALVSFSSGIGVTYLKMRVTPKAFIPEDRHSGSRRYQEMKNG